MTPNSKRVVLIRMIMVLSVLMTLLSIHPQEHALAQTGTVIDSFDSLLSVLVYPPLAPDPNGGRNTDAAVLGGERDIYVDRTAGSTIASGISDDSASEYTHGQNANVYAISWVTWDGPDPDADPTSPDLTNLDLDLEGEGATGFQVRIISADNAGGYLRINLWDIHNDTATIEDALGEVNTPETRSYPFASFTEDANFDRDHVAAIQLEIDGSEVDDLDVRIDWIAFNSPTAVDLADFAATEAYSDVLVTWETANELSLLGFNVQRSDMIDGVYTQVNDGLILAQHPGEPLGGFYSWLDRTVEPGETYFYRLEALEIGGGSSIVGLASAKAKYVSYLPLVTRH